MPRPRAREIGIHIGLLDPGPLNAITDVDGVRVGHVTLHEGDDVRTGVTVVLPHSGNIFREKVPAAIVVGNGFGKLVGVTQVEELGTLETPIGLTNTVSVFRVADGLIDYTLGLPGNEYVRSVNPVVGETNDGYLNDIRHRHVEPEHVALAIENATGGEVDEGAVGAGTGTRCFGFKGGIGTSSRQLPEARGGWTVGVLVQSNFSGSLTVNGAHVGDALGDGFRGQVTGVPPEEDGSCMIVVATDAPLDARQLKRIARRALLGLGATGSAMSHGSGDYVIAFSTVRVGSSAQSFEDQKLTPLFQAVREATEEAILNSLLRATTTTGRDGHKLDAIPIDRLIEACREYRVLDE